MADPLSIASGVAGLVSLGLTLCGSLHNYFSNVKGRHQDIETASRSLTLLQSNIFIIQSSTLKLGHRHALSANGVNQGLANCEFELVALQQLMLNLTRDEGLSDIKAKLRKQMTIARYPFDHKKLMQLQDQLSRANAILGNFVQNFNLDINIGISEDLQVLKNYTNANDSITHNMLGTIARRLDAISPAVQRTEVGMATLSQHAQDNSFDTSSHVSDVIVQPHYVQNSQKEQTMMKTLNDPECTCSDPSTSSICRKSYVNRSWGSWIVSKQEHTRQRHQPNCILFSQSLQRSKTTFHCLGLRYQLSRILSMSLTRDHLAGAYSLSFGIQPCNIVEWSPAFQALYYLGYKYMNDRKFHNLFNIREETSVLIKNLRTIYESAAASPFDVDKHGNNIAHESMKVYRIWLLSSRHLEEISLEDVLASLLSLLSYMFDAGVPISASNFYQETILYDLWDPDYLMELFRLYNFIATLDTSFCGIDICKRKNMVFLGSKKLSDDYLLQVCGKHPEIAEVFGFNDIFRAVMQQDRQKLESIIMGDQLPAGILEKDIYDSLDMCSLRCRRLLFRHYKNRRRRLREISLALSPLEIIHRYGVTVDSIPDATAAFLWDELQSRSDELRRQGFEISSGLKPYYSKYDSCGCFERFQPPEICSLADEFGIRPTDERGIEPLLARVEVLDFSTLGPTFDAETTYLDWLMKHDLKLECMRGGFQTSALHNFGGRIGRILCRFHDVPDRKPPYLWKREAIGLITKICNSDIECNLPCPCVSGVFNRPLASLFSAFATYTPYMDHWSEAIGKACFLVDLIQSIATSVDTSYLAKCAVHINTMELLRVRHVGPCGWIDSSLGITELDEEERVEVLDEDRISLKRLGDLDEEFEQEFQDRNESVVDFLQGYYARRMEEVVREMAEPVGDDYRRGLLAAGVILEEPEESSCDSSLD
ncbi:hypothetical protein FOFC_13401 [Fusarium oxysporum]|nr:hypothetical protein FOFC_13401 [Fusarium oxysporum]